MKKYLLVLLLLILIAPSVALASWWNPFSWFNNWNSHKTEIPTKVEDQKTPEEKIAELNKQIEDLKKQTEQKSTIKTESNSQNNQKITDSELQAKINEALKNKEAQDAIIAKQKLDKENLLTKEVAPPSPEPLIYTPPRIFHGDGSLDFTVYNDLNVRDYIKNPKASLNKPVKITNGIITNFIQGSENYIEVVDLDDLDSVIDFRIENDNNYTTATNELFKYNKVLIYGYGDSSVKFNVIGNGGSYDEYRPIINVDAMFRCGNSSSCAYNYSNGVKSIFQKRK